MNNQLPFDWDDVIDAIEDLIQKIPWKKLTIISVTAVSLFIGVRYFSSLFCSNNEYKELREHVVETDPITEETAPEAAEEKIATHSTISEVPEETLPQETLFWETDNKEPEKKEIDENILDRETKTEETLSYDEYPDADLSEYINQTPSLVVDHNAMKELNADYRCWINIPGTSISYPVPKGPDNDYYLHRTFLTKTEQKAGSLFIDAQCDKGIDQDNLIIYGHNMGDGSMFGTLKKFKDRNWFKEHPYIEMYTEKDTRVYLIFAVRVVKNNIDTLDYSLSDFKTQQYIDNAASESEQFRKIKLIKNGFENSDYRQIITLSTCSVDDERLLVSALRII